ncbi:MAG: TetR/AcrR family transcriptional regulator [Elusimicrobia bacterium]|nr:TetR/AcrR family transcriptional regulator [Elusimicrobiota bacterium]
MPATPRPVVRDPDAKKRHIMEAARRLLVERDFTDIVLDDIAKRAGVAKGTLFLYFKSKEELFAAAFADLVDSLGFELETLVKTDVKGKDLLLAAAKVVLNHFDRNHDFMGHLGAGRMLGCGPRSRGRLLEKFRANHLVLRRILTAASKDQARSIGDSEYAAAAFIGLCRSATMRKLVYGKEGALEREAEAVVAFFVGGSGIEL